MGQVSAPRRGWRRRSPTPWGMWSVRLMVGSILLFLAFMLLVGSGQRAGETFFSNPWLSGTIVSAAGLALGGAGVGLVAAAKDGDRSVGVVAAVVLGTLVLLWIVGEVAFPH